VTGEAIPAADTGSAAVLRNRPFLLLWLAQAATQIGANMVLYGLTVLVLEVTDSSTAVSGLFLTFLIPSVLLSALAGVYVDRLDRRTVLVVTNGLRAAILVAMFLIGHNIPVVLLLNIAFATVTVFFAPAEAAMIPFLVPRSQLVAANGLFTLTLNGAFALGYAFLGPLIVTVAGGPEAVILGVAVLYGIGAAFCATLPSNEPAPHERPGGRAAVAEAGQTVGGTLAQLKEGIAYIRDHTAISWTLVYLGIAASLIGVIGVLGPKFASQTLGLSPKDLIVVVLPLGLGIVMGVLLLNNYGKMIHRRRAIEGGMIALGILLSILTVAGPVSRFLQGVGGDVRVVNLSAVTSLVAVVVALAFLAGIAYGIVAISSQTQLQEDLPEEVRGRVFGVLNMLISVASILPIIIVGTISDLIGTTAVILFVAIAVTASGIVSVMTRGPLPAGLPPEAPGHLVHGTPVDPTGSTLQPRDRQDPDRDDGSATGAPKVEA
jgi:MFS family permease